MSFSITARPQAVLSQKVAVPSSSKTFNASPVAPSSSFLGKSLSASFAKARPAAQKFVVRAEEKEEDSSLAKAEDVRPRSTPPSFATKSSLAYLDGTLPGDYGFDPLGLSDPEGAGAFIDPDWLAYAEVIHGRWAMLATAGCLAPEFLGKMGVIPESTGLVWFRSGVIPPAGTFDYWCDAKTLFFVEVVLMGFAEFRRLQDYRKPGSMGEQYFIGLERVLGGSGEPAYPGGQFFNFFNIGKDDLDNMKVKEIKNGRLAMVAMLGFFVQAFATGKGPVENLFDHIGSGGAINFGTTIGEIGGSF
mmetsp:Transcript_5753/g.6605  ORF Transcript_5753/g.6605 Transcript_5753/m.6605 type:complete len:303 (-) Transcript_5753:257-1165(-)|eukprot:CAMPEP_0197860036 /NCGR_PEP_ID=MMETSP1438-20131217/35117_1 /TAXON_ID=1461541 /ORGANISM="Pterosperma sp., Strain CCMP1384" /LENGTH=302 /DNA_ID=CAMNT_0043476743 /DNA_START=59 /DNA_END=967 /DNA_ORIENTATION=+